MYLDYEPARKNLALLGNQSEVAFDETAAVALQPQRPPSKPSKMSAKQHSHVIQNIPESETRR